ncbi:MAG TPA: AbiV family abortive infection protein [Acidimicrobiales bacterium]|nr:AbiV family abortive infection protein [Acidimicrobiales bacterium]
MGYYEVETQSAFMLAVLQNAHALVADAEVLLSRERWARAHALATLAMEEAGKAWLADQLFQFAPDQPLPPRGWRHEEKLGAAREMHALVGMLRESRTIDMNEWFSEGHQYAAEYDFFTRMTGLYVDLQDGEVVGGPQAVTPGIARATVGLAGPLVHAALQLLWVRYGGPVATDCNV